MDWEAYGSSYLPAEIDVDEVLLSSPGEVWHVAISWDDIKVMTLDQLDDAFRLDIISASTPVWKEGMSGWQPLSVVAGMEEEAPAPRQRLRSVPAEPRQRASSQLPAVRAPSPPPRPKSPPSRAPSAPPRAAARNTAPLRAVPSAPVEAKPRRTGGVQDVAPSRATSPASFAQPAEVAPMNFARSMAPVAYPSSYPRRSGSGQAWFFGPLVLAGIVVALYRNDLLLDTARALHQEARYLQAERALIGTPGFGTPRSIVESPAALAAASLDDSSAPPTTTKTDDAAPSAKRDAPGRTQESLPAPAPSPAH